MSISPTPVSLPQALSSSLNDNLQIFHNIFQQDTTIKFRQVLCGMGKHPVSVIFADGMVNNTLINEHVIEPMITFTGILPDDNIHAFLRRRVLYTNDITENDQIDDLLTEILSGNTVLLVDGDPHALILATRCFTMRSISEPPSEKVLQGPREGFNEVMLFNLSMVRRKMCNPHLRFSFRRLGKQTKTMVAVAYVDGIADPSIVEEVGRRLDQIHIDGILDANYIEELIKDSPWSPFRTVGSTERPDIVSAKLLEGHVAIFIDGTPVVLTTPHFFLEYFQTNDDYYNNFYSGTFNRWLRILGFWSTISLPAIFLGLFTMHQELLPTRFLLNLTAARENLPFPTFLEMLILILGFELIREGGAKAPANFGQTLGIVGGLVLGQAAVEAKLVSIPVVIIIAFTGITGLMIPQLKSPVILFRLLFLIMASIWGIPGYLTGVFLLLLYLSSMKSFSIPYTSALSTNRRTLLQDTLFRSPWFFMKRRPEILSPENETRQRSRIQRSKLHCFLFVFLFLMFFSGCSSREINDVNIVSGITVRIEEIEFSDDASASPPVQYTVLAQIPDAAESETKSRTITGQGRTFGEALEDCCSNSDKNLFWHHSKSIVLPEDVTSNQLYEIVQHIMEHRELRIASDVVLIRSKSESQFQHVKLQEMLLADITEQLLPSRKVYQLFNMLSKGTASVSLPLLQEQDDGSLLPLRPVSIP
ncbi:MAG: spore germination protein [Firmicutes bacterium]|nr:spore germination protein [Bacillota bacterium]